MSSKSQIHRDAAPQPLPPPELPPPAAIFQRTMPRNFSKPLTCFFWAQFGSCKKSDDECVYAHYHTGIIADAPISIAGG